MLDVSRYQTPAKFTMNESGNTVVHAPSDSGLQIITPTSVTISSAPAFLDLEDDNVLLDVVSNLKEDIEDESSIDDTLNKFYSFLNKN